jgi:heme oxygenase (mycobilin-producing)
MFRVMLRVEVVPGSEDDFETTWLEVGNSVTGWPANQGQWLLKSTDEGSVYYIMSDWADEPSFREFERSARHLEHRRKLHPYRMGGSMTTAIMIHDLSKTGTSS